VEVLNARQQPHQPHQHVQVAHQDEKHGPGLRRDCGGAEGCGELVREERVICSKVPVLQRACQRLLFFFWEKRKTISSCGRCQSCSARVNASYFC
jgi:hypothetical protein